MDGNINMYQYFGPAGELQDRSTASSSYEHAAAAAYMHSSGMTLPEPGPSSYITEPSLEGPAQGTSYFPQQETLPHPLTNNMTSSSGIPHNNLHHHHNSSSSSTGSAPISRGNSTRTRHSSPTSPLDHSVNPYPPASSRPRRSPNQRMLALPDDLEDDSEEEPLSPNASAKEKSEWKKRRNTKAARRSRKRKQVYTEQLEATVEQLRLEKETWKTRALTLRQLLKSHNLPCPDFED